MIMDNWQEFCLFLNFYIGLQINKKKSGNVPLAGSLPTIRSSLILRSGTYLAQGSLPMWPGKKKM